MKRSKTAYETLGVSRDATPEQIKKARRKRAAELHPDKGGDTHEMAAVNHAYDVLIDPARRLLYDTTGTERQQKPLADEARQMVLHMFQQALNAEVPNILVAAEQMIEEIRSQASTKEEQLKTRRKKLEQRNGKIKVKNGDNLFQMIIDQELQSLNQGIASCLHAKAVGREALLLLKNYTSDEKEPPQSTVEEQVRRMYFTFR